MDDDVASDDGTVGWATRGRSEASGESADLSALSWVKSSLSMGNGDCVELAQLNTGHVAVRDSKAMAGQVLLFTQSEFRAFVGSAKRGEFDHFT